MSEPAPRPRKPQPPYYWVSKNASRQIRELMNGDGRVQALLCLYNAMAEVASDTESETFTAGQPYPGQLAGMSARNVQRLEPLLEEFGLVRIIRPKLRGHNTYTLLATIRHGVAALRQTRKQATCRPVEEIHKKERKKEPPIVPHGGRVCPASPIGDNGESQPVAIKPADAFDPFAAFWDAYPLKVGKRNAERAWASAAKRGMPPLPELLAKLEALKASPQWRKDGGQFIPHPATWLNRDGWDDEVLEAGRPGSFL
jgi:hypothetical protein